MPRYNSMDKIDEIITNAELKDKPFSQTIRKYECFHNDNLIFTYEYKFYSQPKQRLILSDSLKNGLDQKVYGAIDRSGFRYPYQCELYPSTKTQKEFKTSDKRNLENIDPSEKFKKWFLKWLGNRILVPDTCIIQDHYLTKVVLPRISDNVKIQIPRFVVLELEAMATRKKYNKRISFSAFNEIRKLRLNHNASIFSSQIESDILADFANISSSKRADSFIRAEMWKRMKEYGARDTRERQMVLITKDMIMACTASAENIDTFYLSPRDTSRREFLEFSINDIITELAVALGKIRIEGYKENHSLLLEGMWSGKTISDWENGCLKWELIEK